MKYLNYIFFLLSFGIGNFIMAQTSIPMIDQAIKAGDFTKAKSMISEKIANENLPPSQAYDLLLQSDLLDRIRLDFNKDETQIRTQLATYFPDLTDRQLAAWEATNELEMKIIDGEKRYFYNAVWNLFRINKVAKKRKEKVDGQKLSDLDRFVQGYLPKAVNGVKAKSGKLGNTKRLRINYTLRVKPNMVPEGETIRAWLPYPRTDRDRLSDIKLISTSEPNYIIAPEDQTHRSIYMEQKAIKDSFTVFNLIVEYAAFDEWTDLRKAKPLPYNTNSDIYQKYTSERNTHILFTPAIQKLSEKIVGAEQDPLKKCWLIYNWIGKNIPWASALEYSTMSNIPQYCIANNSGDCGMKSLLFITLCRYNNIPAKWQSGWFLYPDNINLHDWAEVYFEGLGWLPIDPDFNVQAIDNDDAAHFFYGGADAYRFIVNDDYSGTFFPAKIYPRSETVDFQRGEVEWRGGNLYFNTWRYNMEVKYLD